MRKIIVALLVVTTFNFLNKFDAKALDNDKSSISSIFNSMYKEEPSILKYGSIPFGKTLSEVLKMVPEAEEMPFSWDSFYSRSFVGLSKYLKGDFLEDNYNIHFGDNVKYYDVRYRRSRVNLFFIKKFNSDKPYTLFLVNKHLYSINGLDGPGQKVFNALKSSVTKKSEIQPVLANILYFKGSNSYESSPVGIWKSKETTIFLVGKFFANASDIQILYVSNDGWNKYINSRKAYENEQQREQKNKLKKSAEDLNF